MGSYIKLLYDFVSRVIEFILCVVLGSQQSSMLRIHYATEPSGPLKQELLRKKEERGEIVLSYNPTHCDTLSRFQHVVDNSLCLFAKRAKLWGSPTYNRNLPIEENITAALPALLKFASLEDDRLDGFVIEVRGEEYSNTVKSFASTVNRVLKVILL